MLQLVVEGGGVHVENRCKTRQKLWLEGQYADLVSPCEQFSRKEVALYCHFMGYDSHQDWSPAAQVHGSMAHEFSDNSSAEYLVARLLTESMGASSCYHIVRSAEKVRSVNQSVNKPDFCKFCGGLNDFSEAKGKEDLYLTGSQKKIISRHFGGNLNMSPGYSSVTTACLRTLVCYRCARLALASDANARFVAAVIQNEGVLR